ncbi:MAG: hypothetical protein CSB15_00345 [Clostridiales bacterium]|nr:MAG: hypothetical protein CSB15_00345 [Clostridiales bacterium]
MYISLSLDTPIIYDEKIREINNGDLKGLLNIDAEIKYKGIYFNTLNYDEKYPNGESPKEFYYRVREFFNNLISENDDNAFILVTHGGVINIILHIVKKIKWSNRNKPYKIKNGSITLLNCDKNDVKIIFDIKGDL